MTDEEVAKLLWAEIERQSGGDWPVRCNETAGFVDMEIDFIELAAALRTSEGDKG